MRLTLTPPIGTVGSFTFTPPFDTLITGDQEFRVTAVRNLLELENSGEKPFDTIYRSIGLTEAEFKHDLDNNVPIVVFSTTGNEYFYVPADRVLSIPKINGVRYQEMVLAISLGNIPVSKDLTVVKDIIVQDIKTVVGIESTVSEVPASAVGLVDVVKHKEFELLLEGRKTTSKSYRTLYNEALDMLAKKEKRLKELEKYIKDNYVKPQ
jgi:hypothetical protein